MSTDSRALLVLRWLAKRHADEQRDALARLAQKWGEP